MGLTLITVNPYDSEAECIYSFFTSLEKRGLKNSFLFISLKVLNICDIISMKLM